MTDWVLVRAFRPRMVCTVCGIVAQTHGRIGESYRRAGIGAERLPEGTSHCATIAEIKHDGYRLLARVQTRSGRHRRTTFSPVW